MARDRQPKIPVGARRQSAIHADPNRVAILANHAFLKLKTFFLSLPQLGHEEFLHGSGRRRAIFVVTPMGK
jgi:hypothetical protein